MAQDCLSTVIELDPDGHNGPPHRRDDRLHRGAARQRRPDRRDGRSGNPHRLADRDRGRLFHRSRDRALRPDRTRHRRRCREPRPPRHRLRRDPRRAEGAPRRGHRRPSPSCPATTCPATAMSRRTPSRAWPRLSDPKLADWIARQRRLPERHGRPHHPRHRPARTRAGRKLRPATTRSPSPASRSANGCWRTTSPPGRPALEQVGVTFTPHVHAYEAMKIRILNGGHAIIAYPGGLMDIELVHEAMAHPLIRGLSGQGRDGRDHPLRPAGARHRPRTTTSR